MARSDDVLRETAIGSAGSVRPRVLIGKTSLDGHWRGVNIVATALRDAGFEVLLAGMVTGDELVAIAVDEDVDLVGLNVGGRIEVAERVVATLRSRGFDGPVFAGGTLAPYAVRRLTALGVECYPPGSSLDDIIAAARRLTSTRSTTEDDA